MTLLDLNFLDYNFEKDAQQSGFSLYKAVFIIVLITALGFLAMITRLLQVQVAKVLCKKKKTRHHHSHNRVQESDEKV